MCETFKWITLLVVESQKDDLQIPVKISLGNDCGARAFQRMLLRLVTRNGERGTGNGERGTGNGEEGTGERGTENGERRTGMGNGESLKWGIFKMGNL